MSEVRHCSIYALILLCSSLTEFCINSYLALEIKNGSNENQNGGNVIAAKNETISGSNTGSQLDENYGGFPWARNFNYSKEDHEIGLAGHQFERLLEISSFSLTRLLNLSVALESRSASSGIELRATIDEDPFEPVTGTKRTVADCNSTVNDDGIGGKPAVLGTSCVYPLWKKYRKRFLEKIMNTTFIIEEFQTNPSNTIPDFNPFLVQHLDYLTELRIQDTRLISADLIPGDGLPSFKFFQKLCIACSGEPLMMCDRATATCVCWDYYITRAGSFSEGAKAICKLPVGRRCHHIEGAVCVENAFCDQSYTCTCKARKICDRGNRNQQLSMKIILGVLTLVWWISCDARNFI